MLSRGDLSSVEVSRKLARKFFNRRFNCAQSVILSVSKALGVKVPKEVVKTAVVFGGGIGESGCLCGALAGAVMLIGYLFPKSNKEAADFFDIFKERFKSSCCRVLRGGMDFKNPKLKEHCAKITEETASLLSEFLMSDRR